MVLTLQFDTIVVSDGQPHAAMRAAIFPGVDGARVIAPDGEFLTEDLRLDDLARDDLFAACHRKPAPG